ncbi:MAG: hypothetical protein KDK26_03040 [Roseivivax sp.]|nr:hypothetical protein [Roseivivax sp.]
MIGRWMAAILVLGTAAPAMAEVSAMTLRTCAETQIAAGADPGSCLAEAHAPCLAEDISAPAVVALCFAEAERSWGGAIASLLEEVGTRAPERLATLARIEAKYDVLGALVQCDRMQELSQAMTEESDETVLAQVARCRATASALAYVRLVARAKALP